MTGWEAAGWGLLTAWWLPVVMAPFVGSFLGVLVVRLPAGAPVLIARSACPACHRRLAAIDLVPLLSWLAFRGRCRTCRAPLGLFYPAIELAATAVTLWAALTVPPPLLWPTCGLGWVLLTLAMIDAHTLLLPDPLTLPLIPAGLAVAAWLDLPLAAALIGAVAGFAAPAAVRWLYFRLCGREGLGLGDAKLLAAAGAWLGWPGLPGVVLIGALAALAFTLVVAAIERRLDRTRPIPLGPVLCLGFWLVWLYGPLVVG